MAVKEITKQKIVDTAREIFLKKGLFETTMNDIAVGAGLTRRTLYRYFDTKEDLAYKISISLLKEWNNYNNKIYDSLQGNGLQQLETFTKQLVGYMNKRRDIMKYLGEFDFYFKDDSMKVPLAETVHTFNTIILESDSLLESIIKKGINDGSISDTIPLQKTVVTISNVLWSFAQRIAIRGNIIERETGFNPIDLILYQIDIYCRALKKGG